MHPYITYMSLTIAPPTSLEHNLAIRHVFILIKNSCMTIDDDFCLPTSLTKPFL